MRVNELSKQIGKSNKEVLEILQKNHFDVKSHSSKVTEEQAEAVRCFLAGAKRQTTASKTDTGKAETNRVEDIKKEPLEAEKKEAEKTAFYAEYDSYGPGANPKARAAFSHQLKDLKGYEMESVLSGSDNWNPVANGNALVSIKR